MLRSARHNRSMRVELGLAGAGIRQRPLPWLLLCLGVALAVGFPVFAAGLRQESGVAAVTGTLDSLPSYERTVVANTYQNLRGESAARLDRTVRTGLSDARVTSVARALVFKPVSIASTVVSLAALDQVDSRVLLTSGRLPSVCTPTLCEVLSVQLPGVAKTFDGDIRAQRELGIVVTGTAQLTDYRLVGVGLIGANRPLLLGGAPEQMADLTSLQLFGRTLGWFGTLDGRTIAVTGVDRYGRALSALSDEVNLAGEGPLSVTWPADAVAAAEARAAASADRFAVLGAGAGALQLGLCLVVAAWQRRRQQLVGVLLARRGASSIQITGVTLLQAVPAVILGVLIGTGVAALVVALRASGSGTGAGLAAATSAAVSAVPVLIALAVLAVVSVTAVTRWPATGAGAARSVMVSALVASALLPFLVLSGEVGGPASSSARFGLGCRRVAHGFAADPGGRRIRGGRRVADRLGLASSGHDRPSRAAGLDGGFQHPDHRRAPAPAADGHRRVLGRVVLPAGVHRRLPGEPAAVRRGSGGLPSPARRLRHGKCSDRCPVGGSRHRASA